MLALERSFANMKIDIFVWLVVTCVKLCFDEDGGVIVQAGGPAPVDIHGVWLGEPGHLPTPGVQLGVHL